MKRLTTWLVLMLAVTVLYGQEQPAPSKKGGAATNAPRAEVQWYTDFEQAREVAAKKKVPVLLFFTGSDWCPWCMKLEAEVLSQEAFKRFAARELVLFKADFPRRQPVAPALRKQNEDLARRYGVDGFPTIVLINPVGGVIAQTGYRPGGAESYVEYLRALLRGE